MINVKNYEDFNELFNLACKTLKSLLVKKEYNLQSTIDDFI